MWAGAISFMQFYFAFEFEFAFEFKFTYTWKQAFKSARTHVLAKNLTLQK